MNVKNFQTTKINIFSTNLKNKKHYFCNNKTED